MKVILLSGKKRTGKTTLQNALFHQLCKREEVCPIEINFADEIYRIHDYAIKKMKELNAVKPGFVKDRKLLQFLGTEWARNTFSEDVWCEVMKTKIQKAIKNNYTHTIISDCRFKNEFFHFPEALRIRLTADESIRKIRTIETWDVMTEQHPSETDLDTVAVDDLFDMYIATDIYTVEESVKMIIDRLETDWVSKRTP